MPRVIPLDTLTKDTDTIVREILAETREREGRRQLRRFTDLDVRVLLAAIRKHPDAHVRVYAQRGQFVPLSEKLKSETTVVEYARSFGDTEGGIWVSVDDARRPKGRGPYVTVNGEREV